MLSGSGDKEAGTIGRYMQDIIVLILGVMVLSLGAYHARYHPEKIKKRLLAKRIMSDELMDTLIEINFYGYIILVVILILILIYKIGSLIFERASLFS